MLLAGGEHFQAPHRLMARVLRTWESMDPKP